MNEKLAEAARYDTLQLEGLFQRTRTSSVLALLPIVLIAALHYGHVATAPMLMWSVAMLGVYGMRILIAHTFISRQRQGDASPLWLDIETMTTAAAGGGWGAMLFLLNTGQLDMLFTVKLAFLAAACAFTMNSMAAVRFVYLAFLLPVFTIVTGYALMETPYLTAAERYGLIASASLFFVLLLIMSASVSRLMNEALAQRLAFSDLAAQLEISLDAERKGREQLEQQARQMEATHLQLHVFATHDPLTRVFNRHRISEALVRELHLRRRYQIQVSVLVVEIDGFADISEGRGQACGDQLLIAFATFLAADLREIDYVGRWGGEKFCCVLPRTDGRESLECAERLRRRIEDRRFIESDPELAVTASFGVSPAVDGDDPERLLARADAALYSARREGRNCSRVLSAEESPEADGTSVV
ncbi:MAG: GGDEF domain-containing protein [Betaproteobacteria bacterium]|uniref:diguanylate cyclase n=1 Tax=Candidatus Proximibacter danicus TaxID=2954365 RepID=A0A9D7K169_9PROT|nr:GGDEF domain-containing protein [Candidatus Proximibacter danicus]MBK9444782.1 GGDEF domain-containing protein [Betaproteobacteria bacterium]